MPSRVRRTLLKLPPLAWRDRRIAGLEARVRKLESARTVQVVRPSFEAAVQAERRMAALRRGMTGGIARPTGKFSDYDVARSHGVDIPRQLGRWDHPDQIAWDDLPDLVVVKSAHGSTGRGVFPLRRVGDGWQIATRTTVVSSTEIVHRFLELEAAGRNRGPYGAEEFLEGPDGPGSLPIDVKAFTFYGDVPGFLLCRRPEFGRQRANRYRYVDATGRDLDGVIDGSPTDYSIEPPANLDEFVETASRLSIAFAAAFLRVDLYGIGSRVVFGEVTPRPGGEEWFGPELDTAFGEAWEGARARLYLAAKRERASSD
jgi:hypothetical protein